LRATVAVYLNRAAGNRWKTGIAFKRQEPDTRRQRCRSGVTQAAGGLLDAQKQGIAGDIPDTPAPRRQRVKTAA